MFTLAILPTAPGIAYASAEFFDVSLALDAFADLHRPLGRDPAVLSHGEQILDRATLHVLVDDERRALP